MYRLQFKYGIKIGEKAEIGPGFYIYHYGGIFINDGVKIGKNVDIFNDVTLGWVKGRGEKKSGSPIVGDNVFIGAGAKILGPIHIADGSAIGANAVVTKDTEGHSSYAGNPAKKVSDKGSQGLQVNLV